MTGKLLLLAHGETAATRRAAFADGESLAPTALARLGRAPRCDLALTSPAAAARETAAALQLAAATDTGLRDLDVGAWAGRPLAEIAAADPAGAAAFVADPAFGGHGGESIEALIARMEAWLATQLGARGCIVAITHAAVVRAVTVAVLGAPPSAFWRIDVAPLDALAFSSDGRRWSLRAGAAADG